MKKKILIVTGIIIVIIVAMLAWSYFTVKPDAFKVAEFIKQHPDKAAIYIIRNDTVLASQNADSIMPLASTVKTIVAIEFARQAAAGIINFKTLIDTLELDKYFLPGTDGGAHKNWLNQMREDSLFVGSKVKILDVAKGMVRYSSNANTEYLMDLLGFDNLNAQLDSLGLKGHHKLYPFISSLVVCAKPKGEDIKPFTEKLDKMPMDEYIRKSFEVHEKLKHDPSVKANFDGASIYIDQQKIWSNRLPGGSPKQYASIMKKINSRTYFDTTQQIIIDAIFEWPMIDIDIAAKFKHRGMKGGSTAFVLTQALYATDDDNNKTVIAVFFNNLYTLQSLELRSSCDEFNKKVLNDADFRTKLTELFKP